MCGIAGIMPSTGFVTDELIGIIKRMTARLSHRGPDDEGLWSETKIALGHRRLSVIELSSAGAQPMHSDCGRYVLIFNGEIYNHLDLRTELQILGSAPSWRGQSDTETLLASISHWGLDETLRRAAGMFAIALWDRRERRLSLARDRMGEKPLYWGWAGRAFVFASELKALRCHPDFPRDICREALAQYLSFGYIPAPRSIHPGIFKLEPGCILSVESSPPSFPPEVPLRPLERHSSISIRRYWSLYDHAESGCDYRFATEREALDVISGALHKAVARQTMADVPIGAFLSGGIDSSLITAIMQAQSTRAIKTFTVGFEDAAFNEAPFASEIARHLGTDHNELIVTEAEARELIPSLATIFDEPFADSSQIPTYFVCKAARAHVTVALSGDGGDELFGGYNRYIWGPRIWRWLDSMPHSVRKGMARMIGAMPIGAWDQVAALTGGRVARLGQKAHRIAAHLHYARTVDDLYRIAVSEWPGDKIVAGLNRSVPTAIDDSLPKAVVGDAAARMMFNDMRTYLPDDIFCKVDRSAMAVSLETRIPFVDPEVLLASGRLPIDMKIRSGHGKWALRNILERYVPRPLFERPKTGFGIPVGEWLRGPLRSWADELLSEKSLRDDGLIDPVPVINAWAEHTSRRRDWTNRLWIVLMLMTWRASNK